MNTPFIKVAATSLKLEIRLQWTLFVASSSGLVREFACYNETLLYQGYKNNTTQMKSDIKDHQNYLVMMKVCYISARYNKSPLYKITRLAQTHNLVPK